MTFIWALVICGDWFWVDNLRSWERYLTSYCHNVHSNELGTFISQLMLRAIQPITTNIFYDHPLVCGIQLHHQDMGRNNASFFQNMRRSSGHKDYIPKLEQLVKVNCVFPFVFKWHDGRGNSRKNRIKFCIFIIRVYENLNFQFWKSYAYFGDCRSALIEWCVSFTMNFNATFYTFLVWGVVHIIKMAYPCNGQQRKEKKKNKNNVRVSLYIDVNESPFHCTVIICDQVSP